VGVPVHCRGAGPVDLFLFQLRRYYDNCNSVVYSSFSGSPYQPIIEELRNYPQKRFYNVSKLGGTKYGNDNF